MINNIIFTKCTDIIYFMIVKYEALQVWLKIKKIRITNLESIAIEIYTFSFWYLILFNSS